MMNLRKLLQLEKTDVLLETQGCEDFPAEDELLHKAEELKEDKKNEMLRATLPGKRLRQTALCCDNLSQTRKLRRPVI